MKVSVIGLGWYGEPLAGELKKRGHEVRGTTTREEKKAALELRGISAAVLGHPALPPADLLGSDVIVLNIPPFTGQLEWLKLWPWRGAKLVFVSSTSVLAGTSPILQEEERWVRENFDRAAILRFGGLLGGGRHPGKFLSGRENVPHRLWPVNLLHLEDAVGFTLTVLEKNLSGTFDVVCDEHRSREEFYTEFARRRNLPPPLFDQSDSSTRAAIPNNAVKAHYTFRVTDLNS